MAYSFQIESAALRRHFAVYVVVAKGQDKTQLYIGKTGDNRAGCNPLISRCGNHFSYNKIHSQVRNKIEAHESWQYTYVFDHFGEYPEDAKLQRAGVEKINELERWLNVEMQRLIRTHPDIVVVNPFRNRAWVDEEERKRRASFRTSEVEKKLRGIVAHVSRLIGIEA